MRGAWLAAALALAARGAGGTRTAEQGAALAGSRFNVSWWQEDGELVLRVAVRGGGWWGLGLSSSGKMDGADIVVGRVSNAGPALIDCHGVGNGAPVRDASQDYRWTDATFDGEVQSMVIRRPLELCGPDDYDASQGGTARLLWALPEGGANSVFPTGPHSGSERGSISAALSYFPESTVPTSELSELVLNSAVHVPAYPGGGVGQGLGTTYWCVWCGLGVALALAWRM
jgi:hypothetical protein